MSYFQIRFTILLIIIGYSDSAVAQDSPFTRDMWDPIAPAGELEQAKELCTNAVGHPDVNSRSEAHICLFNLAISQASGPLLIGTGNGGGFIREAFAGPELETALTHLDSARALTPLDLSIHQARQHVLLRATLYNEALLALDDALEALDVLLNTWFDYTAYYFDDGRFEDGLSHLRILESHYDEDPRLVADIGAFLTLLNRDDEAEPYLTRAVELSPNDPINVWNLARFRFYMGQLDDADALYQRALELDSDWAINFGGFCVYADFLDDHRNQPNVAAELRETYSCPNGN